MSNITDSVVERFWAKVDKSGECWLWTAYTMPNGYGKFTFGGRKQARCVLAHRLAYELATGQIDEALQVDHLCRTTNCVRPSHLELVTPTVNNFRSSSPTSVNAHKTHCVRGHPFDEANTRITVDGWRACRQCRAFYRAKYGRTGCPSPTASTRPSPTPA